MTEKLEESGTGRSVQEYLRMVKARRWWIMIPAFCVWALIWSGTWLMSSKYKSDTLIMVEPQKVPDQYVVANVTDIQKRLETLTQQVESRSRILATIKQYNLYPELAGKVAEDDLVERMRKDLSVEPVQTGGRGGEISAFRVSFISKSPIIAQKVTETIAQSFIEENVNSRAQASEATTDFLDTQLAQKREELAKQEENIRIFKNAHLGQLPAQLQPNLTILQGLQTRLEAQIDALNRAKQQTAYFESLLGQYRSIQTEMRRTGGSIELPSALDKELTRMKSELADLSGRYTDQHPDIRKLKQQIAATEAAKRQLAQKTTGTAAEHMPTSSNDMESNTQMVQLDSQLKASRLEVAQREKDVQRISGQIAQMQGRIDATPAREQQLTDITRDYEQSKKEYEALLAKRNQSELATNLVQQQKDQQFRILDPASFPTKPVAPKRMQFAFMGLVAGLAIGVMIAGAKEFWDDYLRGEHDLSMLVESPVLVSIPMLASEQEASSVLTRLRLEYAGVAFLMCIMLAGLAVTYVRG